MWRSKFTTCHKSFKTIGGRSVHIFSMGCCKSAHYDSKGAVQTCFFGCWFLVMIILFVILRKRSRNKHVKTKIYHMSQSFKKIGGRSVHILPWDAVKVSTMIQKGAVQTTSCFWCWLLVMTILFVILRKRSRNKNVKINIYHMSRVI